MQCNFLAPEPWTQQSLVTVDRRSRATMTEPLPAHNNEAKKALAYLRSLNDRLEQEQKKKVEQPHDVQQCDLPIDNNLWSYDDRQKNREKYLH